VPEAAAAVDAWRERTCEAKPSTGVPASITLIFPFVPASETDDDLIAEVGALIGTGMSFCFALQETDRFPAVLFLAPNPPSPSYASPMHLQSATRRTSDTAALSVQASRTSRSHRATMGCWIRPRRRFDASCPLASRPVVARTFLNWRFNCEADRWSHQVLRARMRASALWRAHLGNNVDNRDGVACCGSGGISVAGRQ
jgi:hypothetical protein